jgi:acyl-CoA dehydrogenase
MDFHFSDDQDELASLARRILTDKVNPALLQQVEEGQDRFDPDLWQALGAAGLIGIGLPEEFGGGGGGVIEQCIVLEEAGRVLAPAPLLPAFMGAAAIARFGTAAQKHAWLPGAATGEKLIAPAFTEPAAADPESVETVAAPAGGSWRLNGVKTGVTAGLMADLLLVSARVGDEPRLFLVGPEDPGVTVIRQHTSNRDGAAYVELHDCRLGEERLLGGSAGESGALKWIIERETAGLCALQVGVLEEALAATAAYTSERIAFGRPIATFQAVGQRAADAYIDVEGARLTMWQAAWRLSADLPASIEVEVAKYWAAEAGHRVAHSAVHLHGGMGVAVEYPLHRYFLWGKQLEFSLGGASEQLVKIGEALREETA